MKPRVALLAALLVFAGGATPALAQYRIGMSAAITGPASSTYAPTYEAYKVYFKRVNDAGGINGKKVEIAYEDDRGEPQRAAANAKKLAEGSILMVNASTSATYKPFMTESEAEKIPLMFGGGVCPREAFPPASPLIFCSTSFGSKWDSRFALGFIKEQAAGKKVKVGFAAQDIPLSRIELEFAEQLAKEMGLESIPVVVVPGTVYRVGRVGGRPRRAPGPGRRAERLESSAVTSTGSFLARAVADARSDAERRAERLPLDVLRAAAADLPPARGLRAAVRRGPDGPRVIAEVKRRSPSKGDIRIDLDPAALAAAYAAGGASAVSVLTEPRHFAGSPDDLLAVRAAVELPVLRKDFVTDRYQIWEARAWGADAVLLIVAALDPPALRALLDEAAEAGLDALVEVHTRAEAETAADAGATLVGVNARDLATLEVDPHRFAAVRQALPDGTVLVAESGIRDRAGVQAAADAGADAVLVGEALVLASDPARAVRDLLDGSGRSEMDRPPQAASMQLPAKH